MTIRPKLLAVFEQGRTIQSFATIEASRRPGAVELNIGDDSYRIAIDETAAAELALGLLEGPVSSFTTACYVQRLKQILAQAEQWKAPSR